MCTIMSGKLTKPIMLRLSEDDLQSMELAAKAEGLILQEWIRSAIEAKLKSCNICPDCNTYNSSDSKFCKKCGKKLINIQQRLLTKRNNILAYFTLKCVNYIEERKSFTSNKEFNLYHLQKLIINAESLIKSWSEHTIIIQQLKEEILQYDMDSEIEKGLEEQNILIDNINGIMADLHIDLIRYNKLINEHRESKLETNSKKL